MKRIAVLIIAVGMLGGLASIAPVFGQAQKEASPIYGVKIPAGYSDWKLISVARVGPPVNDLRVKLGNDLVIKAYRANKLPFPDGAIIARLAWNQAMSEENNKVFAVFARQQGLTEEQVQNVLAGSIVAGSLRDVQFMVKNSKKYGSTGGWGFGEFRDGKPTGEDVHKTCFACHEPGKDRDFVFTRYAPR